MPFCLPDPASTAADAFLHPCHLLPQLQLAPLGPLPLLLLLHCCCPARPAARPAGQAAPAPCRRCCCCPRWRCCRCRGRWHLRPCLWSQCSGGLVPCSHPAAAAAAAAGPQGCCHARPRPLLLLLLYLLLLVPCLLLLPLLRLSGARRCQGAAQVAACRLGTCSAVQAALVRGGRPLPQCSSLYTAPDTDYTLRWHDMSSLDKCTDADTTTE